MDGSTEVNSIYARSPIEKRLFALGKRHLDSSNRDVRNLAAVLFEHIPRLFLFVEQEGVEPTNNGAERELRPMVQASKVSFGNRSANGELATLPKPAGFRGSMYSPIFQQLSPAIGGVSNTLPYCPVSGYLNCYLESDLIPFTQVCKPCL